VAYYIPSRAKTCYTIKHNPNNQLSCHILTSSTPVRPTRAVRRVNWPAASPNSASRAPSNASSAAATARIPIYPWAPELFIDLSPGTWLDSDSHKLNGELQVESNVTRIARAILPEDDAGIQQIVYYHKGVGASGRILDRVVMGAVGEGLNQNVREAYSFVANNYALGDEIYLIGFSRGAFTVRTVAGLIDAVGMLTKRGLGALPEVFNDVLNRRNPHYRARLPDVPFRDKPSASNPRYRAELERVSPSLWRPTCH